MKKNGLSIHGFTSLNLFLTHQIPNQTKIKHPLNVYYKTKQYAKKKKKIYTKTKCIIAQKELISTEQVYTIN